MQVDPTSSQETPRMSSVAVPEMSPMGMLPRKQPPLPTPPNNGHNNNNDGGANQFYLFENLPNGVSASDGESSTFSLPNVPSPMSAPSPSIVDLQPTTAQHDENYHQGIQGNFGGRRDRGGGNRNEEEDTFYDDRSLEHRIQRTLQNAPRPVQMSTQTPTPYQQNQSQKTPMNTTRTRNYHHSTHRDTPSSVPVTPTGPSIRGNRTQKSQSQSYWKHAKTPASNRSLRTNQQQQQQQRIPTSTPHKTSPTTLYEQAAHVHDDNRNYVADDVDENNNILQNDNENNHDNNNNNLMSHRASMAILKLKTDLRNAVHQNYLIQQEKEATETKVRDLQRKYDQVWQEKVDAEERATSQEQERRATEQTQQQLTQDLQRTVRELEKVTTDKQQGETQLDELKREVATLKKENQDLSNRMRSLIREHQEDLTTFNDSTEGRLSRMRKELDAALKDNATLRTSLEEAQNLASERTTALEEEKAKSETDLIEMTEKHDACIRQMEQFETIVQSTKKQSEDRIGSLLSQQKELKQKQESDQIEIIRLRNALKEASKESGKASASNLKAENELVSLQEEHETLQGKIDEMTVSLQNTNQHAKNQSDELRVAREQLKKIEANAEKHLAEIERLESALEKATKSAAPTVAAAGATSKANMSQTNPSNDPFKNFANVDETTSIFDRLTRIRDAADRASLVKDHHREIAHLKDHYESKIKSLSTRLQQRMEDSMSSVKTELHAKHTVNVEALQSDWQARLATLERRHQEEVEMLKNEHGKQTSISDENLAVASAKLAGAKSKMDREILKREQFQATVNNLEQQLISEKRRISAKHKEEVKSLRAIWEDEKRVLLDVIQRECNLVFEEKRNESVTEMSPRSVDFDFSNTKHVLTQVPESHDAVDVDNRVSLAYSPKIDAELRETEALVQSLVNGKIQDGGQ